MKWLDQATQKMSQTVQRIRRSPKVGVALLVAAALLAAVSIAVLRNPSGVADALSSPVDALVMPSSYAEAKERAAKNPDSARAHYAVGRLAFKEGRRSAGLAAYERALVLDKGADDDAMYEDLVRCFGTRQQGDAASLITRFKLVGVEERLDDLARHDAYTVRWGALQTLERLGKASRADFVTAWTQDLESEDCDVRRRAVENLGKEGEPRALAAIRAAKQKDQANRGFFGNTCLGGLPDEAEKRILTRR